MQGEICEFLLCVLVSKASAVLFTYCLYGIGYFIAYFNIIKEFSNGIAVPVGVAEKT